jgi:peptidoglycan/LPS O-acetylase OafA/YrhL
MRVIGWSLLVVGLAIAGLWTSLLVTGQVPEVDEGRVDIWFHLAAELATAGVLIAAGTALLRRSRHGRLLAAVAVGALAYTTVNSPGYYAESGEWAIVGTFMVLLILTIAIAVALVRGGRPDEPADGPSNGPSGPKRTAGGQRPAGSAG